MFTRTGADSLESKISMLNLIGDVFPPPSSPDAEFGQNYPPETLRALHKKQVYSRKQLAEHFAREFGWDKNWALLIWAILEMGREAVASEIMQAEGGGTVLPFRRNSDRRRQL